MADAALYKVVQTALGLPQAMSAVDIDRQASILSEKIDVGDFSDPKMLDKFITSFTAKWQANAKTASSSVPQIGLAQPILTSFDNSLLLSMQTLKGQR